MAKIRYISNRFILLLFYGCIATTDSINSAIRKVKAEGFEKIKLTKGEYLISSKGNDRWSYPKDGIFVPSNTSLDLSDATLTLEPNNNEIYNMIIVDHVENVTITGGHLIGEIRV